MRTSLLSGIGFAILGAFALVSCSGSGGGRSTTPTSPTAGPSTVTVNIVGSIGNTAYRPNPVAANPGDTVMFRNNDAAMHHIVMDDGSADLGDVMPGATSRALVLSNTAAAKFHCSVHPSMVGAINAATAPEPKPCPDPYGYGC
jgi:plastocyanin